MAIFLAAAGGDPIVLAASIALIGTLAAGLVAGIFGLLRRNNRQGQATLNPGPSTLWQIQSETLRRMEAKADRSNLLLALILQRLGGEAPPE